MTNSQEGKPDKSDKPKLMNQAELRGLDQALRAVPWNAQPRRFGWRGGENRGVSDGPGGEGPGGGCDAKPSDECAGVSLSQSIEAAAGGEN
jgi:hypothetical protein